VNGGGSSEGVVNSGGGVRLAHGSNTRVRVGLLLGLLGIQNGLGVLEALLRKISDSGDGGVYWTRDSLLIVDFRSLAVVNLLDVFSGVLVDFLNLGSLLLNQRSGSVKSNHGEAPCSGQLVLGISHNLLALGQVGVDQGFETVVERVEDGVESGVDNGLSMGIVVGDNLGLDSGGNVSDGLHNHSGDSVLGLVGVLVDSTSHVLQGLGHDSAVDLVGLGVLERGHGLVESVEGLVGSVVNLRDVGGGSLDDGLGDGGTSVLDGLDERNGVGCKNLDNGERGSEASHGSNSWILAQVLDELGLGQNVALNGTVGSVVGDRRHFCVCML
jgi:hypothetical protein